jgi:surface antigen
LSVSRLVLGLSVPLALLAACTTTTDGAGSTGANGSLTPADGGLGVNATGGLLAASANGRMRIGAEPKMAGRLLEGPYLILLSPDDIRRARRAALTALEETPAGQTTIWRNPANGHWGTLTPTRTFQDARGRYCRDYRQTVTTGGQEHQGNGSACLDPESIWRIMS